MDVCTNKYHRASAIYILSCIYFVFCIIIDRAIGTPGHVKDIVDGQNDRYKHMLKL